MFAIMRGPVRVVLWMLIALHAITAVTCLKAGIYSIRSLSKKSSCENTYLSYTTSGRTKMQSADAKRPSTWRIMPTSGARGVYTVSPSSTRLSSSKLSYSKALRVKLREAQLQGLAVLGDEVCLQGGGEQWVFHHPGRQGRRQAMPRSAGMQKLGSHADALFQGVLVDEVAGEARQGVAESRRPDSFPTPPFPAIHRGGGGLDGSGVQRRDRRVV